MATALGDCRHRDRLVRHPLSRKGDRINITVNGSGHRQIFGWTYGCLVIIPLPGTYPSPRTSAPRSGGRTPPPPPNSPTSPRRSRSRSSPSRSLRPLRIPPPLLRPLGPTPTSSKASAASRNSSQKRSDPHGAAPDQRRPAPTLHPPRLHRQGRSRCPNRNKRKMGLVHGSHQLKSTNTIF